MNTKRIRCECGRVYEPAKTAACPDCGAPPMAAGAEVPRPTSEKDKPLVRPQPPAEDVRSEDAKPLAISGRTLAIAGGVLLALIVLVALLKRPPPKDGGKHGAAAEATPTATVSAVSPALTTAPYSPPPVVTPPPGGNVSVIPQPFDLAAAIASAPSGGTVKVPPGLYQGGFVVSRPVRLVATGGQAVIQADGRECLSVRAPEVFVQGIQFTCNGIGELPAISVAEGADLEFDGCRIQSGTALGVAMSGNSGLKALGTSFTSTNGIALRLQQGKANLTQCTFPDSKTAIQAYGSAKVELQSCAFERDGGTDASGAIISATGQETSVTTTDCHFTGNYAGLFLNEGAVATISNCSFKDNGATSSGLTGLMFIRKAGRASIRGSSFEGNRQGIAVNEGGILEMDQCVFNGNGAQQTRQMVLAAIPIGVSGQGTTATVRNTAIANSTQLAVLVFNGGDLTLENVEVSGAKTAGLQVGDTGSAPARAEIRRGKFHHNPTGIGIFAGSLARVEDSEVSDNNEGIVVGERDSQLEMRKTKLFGNREHGVVAYAEGKASMAESEFRNNGRGAQSGMPRKLAGKAFLSLEDCVFGGNRVFGVGALAQSELTMTRVTFDGTDKQNIYKERNAIVQTEATPAPMPSPDASASPDSSVEPSPSGKPQASASPQKRPRPTPRRPRRPEDDAERILRQLFGPRR